MTTSILQTAALPPLWVQPVGDMHPFWQIRMNKFRDACGGRGTMRDMCVLISGVRILSGQAGYLTPRAIFECSSTGELWPVYDAFYQAMAWMTVENRPWRQAIQAVPIEDRGLTGWKNSAQSPPI